MNRTWEVRRAHLAAYKRAVSAGQYITAELVGGACDDLRHPEYRGDACPVRGHCYVASEALYHLGGREAGYTPRVGRVGSVRHWWLENINGSRMDLTAAQFDTVTLQALYAAGRGCGFLTRMPSKRARALISRTAGGHFARCYPTLVEDWSE